jgi:hypothetical protein
MWRRKFDLVITLLLLLLIMATGVTGLPADYLGAPRSLFHRYVAYLLIIMVVNSRPYSRPDCGVHTRSIATAG